LPRYSHSITQRIGGVVRSCLYFFVCAGCPERTEYANDFFGCFFIHKVINSFFCFLRISVPPTLATQGIVKVNCMTCKLLSVLVLIEVRNIAQRCSAYARYATVHLPFDDPNSISSQFLRRFPLLGKCPAAFKTRISKSSHFVRVVFALLS